ncbi:hypothetical protein EMIT0P294_10464 [Pseudomonas sp. IT-P294]
MLSITICGVFSPLFYGGHAQGVFGRAGLLTSRSTNLCMVTTRRLVARVMAPIYDERSFTYVQTNTQPTRNR